MIRISFEIYLYGKAGKVDYFFFFVDRERMYYYKVLKFAKAKNAVVASIQRCIE